jgi:hypothetical protein
VYYFSVVPTSVVKLHNIEAASTPAPEKLNDAALARSPFPSLVVKNSKYLTF